MFFLPILPGRTFRARSRHAPASPRVCARAPASRSPGTGLALQHVDVLIKLRNVERIVMARWQTISASRRANAEPRQCARSGAAPESAWLAHKPRKRAAIALAPLLPVRFAFHVGTATVPKANLTRCGVSGNLTGSYSE